MSIENQLLTVLKKGDKEQLVSFFLNKNVKSHKKSIKKTIKKRYLDTRDTLGEVRVDIYRVNIGDDILKEKKIKKLSEEINDIILEREMLEISFFLCADSFEEIRRSEITIPLETLEEYILPRYRPSWLNRYFLEVIDYSFGYDSMLRFMKKGWLHPTKEFIAQNAAEGLLKSKDRLEKYIWYLFEYYTNIGYGDQWIKRFKELIQSGDIERTRVLREALLTSNRGFNKPFTGWFCKLLASLEPSKEELLFLQNELFLSLSSPHSKPVGDALKYLKQIAKNPDFKIETFIEHIPLLLTWNVKSIVVSTLSMLDLLMNTYPEQKETLGPFVVEILRQEDERLQLKALKLLDKHKLLKNKDIIDEIKNSLEGLYHSVREKLPISYQTKSITDDSLKIANPVEKKESRNFIDMLEPIEYPKEVNQLIFFFSTIFENNDPIAFDTVLRNILTMNRVLDIGNIDKFIPIIQNVYKIAHSSNYNKGIVLYIAIDLLLRYAQLLGKKFPTYSDKINEILIEMPYFNYIHTYVYSYEPFLHLSHLTQEKLLDNTEIPLLSSPTHRPAFIEMSTLINRIKTYEENNLKIDPIDLQIAISRVIPDNRYDSLIRELESQELKALLRYVNGQPMLIDEIKNPQFWITALLIKQNKNDIQNFRDNFESDEKRLFPYDLPYWEGGVIDYKNGLYSKKALEYISTDTPRPGINFEHKLFYKSPKIDNIFTQINTIDLDYNLHKYDDEKFILLSPHYPDPILINSMRVHNYDKIFPRSNVLRHAENILPVLSSLWNKKNSTISYLYLACSLLDKEKTNRALAAELWYKSTIDETMMHRLLGKTLGKLEHNEYAPLKRFTDLVTSHMLHLSDLHDQGLHALLSSMIATMNDEPIKGTKKLLEIYAEVLSLTGEKVPHETVQKLATWGEMKSLKSIVKKILKD